VFVPPLRSEDKQRVGRPDSCAGDALGLLGVRTGVTARQALLALSVWLAAALGPAVAVVPDAPPADVPASAAPSLPADPLTLEDVPEVLQPKRPRDEQEEDRLEALSLFSAARMLEMQGEEDQALRLYQRALRCDPRAVSIARAVIPLAVRLKRHAEAVRYALLAAELEDADPLLLSRLGVYLAERGDWQRAAALYEKALAARHGAEPTAADLVLRMQLGRLYHLTGQYEKASDSFAQVFQAIERPDDFNLDETARKLLLDEPQATYNLIGECFLLGGRPNQAAAAFKKANEALPNKALLSYNLARVDAKVGKPQSALKRLNACFNEDLSDQGVGPYRLLAEVLADLDRQEELLERLEKLHREHPDSFPLGYFLAEQYAAAGKIERAEPLYRELIGKNPFVAGYRALVEIYRKAERNEELLDTIAEAVEKTAALEPLGEQGAAIAADDQRIGSLLEIARRRLKQKPESLGYSGRLAMALLALEAGKFDAAGEMFDLAIQAKPDQAAELLLSWGLGLLIAEEFEAAAKAFQRGLDEKALPDDNPIFYFYLAGALEMAGRSEEALAAARKAVEVKPESPRFHSRVGWILFHGDRLEEAVKAYEDLVERFESEYGSAEVREVLREARLVLSNLAVLTGRPDEAEEWLEQVLDEFPEDASALNDLGYLWADAGKHLRRAHGMIEKAVLAEPDNPAYRDSLGWVLFRLGRLEEAVAALEKAAADEPDPVILDHLGDAYSKSGKHEKAVDAWRRALEDFRQAEDKENAAKVESKIREQ